MSSDPTQSPRKILVPVATFTDKRRLFQALQLIAAIRDPLVVLFRVVEVPQRTNPLDPSLWKDDITKAENFLGKEEAWLKSEGYRVEPKAVTARDTAKGIIDEANNG